VIYFKNARWKPEIKVSTRRCHYEGGHDVGDNFFFMRGNEESNINLLTPDTITLRLLTWEVYKSGLKAVSKPVVR